MPGSRMFHSFARGRPDYARAVPPEPSRRRPGFSASYGIAAEEAGMLDWGFAVERLQAARNYWVVTTRPDGSPHAMPVWGLWLDDAVVFGTAPTSRKGRNLARDPRVVVHLESGDEVVVVEGEAEPARPDERVVDAYEAKYDFRPELREDDSDGWFRVRPRRAYAWLESDYPRTATRFDFES